MMADEGKKKKPTESTSAATEGVTAQEQAERKGQTTVADLKRQQAREALKQATGVANLQASEASKGAYGGLGGGDRALAERMVRSGEAKTRDEAAEMIRKRRQPKESAGGQAKSLSK